MIETILRAIFHVITTGTFTVAPIFIPGIINIVRKKRHMTHEARKIRSRLA